MNACKMDNYLTMFGCSSPEIEKKRRFLFKKNKADKVKAKLTSSLDYKQNAKHLNKFFVNNGKYLHLQGKAL